MQKIKMFGYDMEGPYRIESDPRVPETSGIYVVLTKTLDKKIRGVYMSPAENLKEHIDNNPRKDCWKEKMINELSIWIYSTKDMSQKDKDKLFFRIREDRQYHMPCRD